MFWHLVNILFHYSPCTQQSQHPDPEIIVKIQLSYYSIRYRIMVFCHSSYIYQRAFTEANPVSPPSFCVSPYSHGLIFIQFVNNQLQSFFFHFLTLTEVQLIYDVVIISAQWFNYSYTHIHSFSDPFPTQIFPEYWVEFPVLDSSSLQVEKLVIKVFFITLI